MNMRNTMVLAGLVLAAMIWVPEAHAISSAYGCDSCHVPHNAGLEDAGEGAEDIRGIPLWNPARNKDLSAMTPYSSDTLNAAPGQPDGISKLCLSCHDGTGSYREASSFGPDLSNMHPISFVYDDTLAADDGDLFTPSTTLSSLGGTVEEDMLDPDGKLQCSSCHDPHSSAAVQEGLLRISNEHGFGGSRLCKTCHDK